VLGQEGECFSVIGYVIEDVGVDKSFDIEAPEDERFPGLVETEQPHIFVDLSFRPRLYCSYPYLICVSYYGIEDAYGWAYFFDFSSQIIDIRA